MNDNTNTQNLMFLLVAAPMGIGCVIVTDDTDDTTGVDTGNVTTGQTTEADTAGTDTPVTGEGTATDDSADSTSRGEESTAGTDSTGVDSTTGGGGAADCQAFGDHEAKCMVPYSEYAADYCTNTQMIIADYYPDTDCAVLFDEYVVCLTMLACEELNGDSPCPDEAAALADMGCPTLE